MWTIWEKYDFDVFKEMLIEILKKGIERNVGIEINTSGLSKRALNGTLPSKDLLKLYRELGGEILTIGSDSHAAATVGSKIGDCLINGKRSWFH